MINHDPESHPMDLSVLVGAEDIMPKLLTGKTYSANSKTKFYLSLILFVLS